MALKQHMENFGGKNYKVPIGIINRFKAIANELLNEGNEASRRKIVEWSPMILEILQTIFNNYSKPIREIQKLSLSLNQKEEIEIQCPICKTMIKAQRPNKLQQRFDLIVHHILNVHHPEARRDYNEYKSSHDKKKRKLSSPPNTQQQMTEQFDRADDNSHNPTSVLILQGANESADENLDEVSSVVGVDEQPVRKRGRPSINNQEK